MFFFDPANTYAPKNGFKINWCNHLKAIHDVISHVAYLGITIAFIDVRDEDTQTVATITMKTSTVNSQIRFFQIIWHDIEGDMQGLAAACFDTASATVQPFTAKYIFLLFSSLRRLLDSLYESPWKI